MPKILEEPTRAYVSAQTDHTIRVCFGTTADDPNVGRDVEIALTMSASDRIHTLSILHGRRSLAFCLHRAELPAFSVALRELADAIDSTPHGAGTIHEYNVRPVRA